MKLRLGLVVTSVLLAAAPSCKRGAEPAAPPSTQPAEAPRDPWKSAAEQKKSPLARPLLWAVEKDGKTLHVLGTMHVGVDAEARLPASVWQRLDASPALAVETDIDDPSIANLGTRTAGGTLHAELGDAYWAKLEAALTPQVAQALDNKTAAIPAALLSLSGLPETPPMDTVLLERAKRRKARIIYLEPASRQAQLLEKHMNIKALKMMLDQLPNVERQSGELLAAYLSGDETKLLAIIGEQRRDALAHGYTEAEYDESIEDLLYRRNESWIAPLERMHAAGGGFVAVGAAHLIGPRSVLALLESKGFRVARVAP